MARLSVFPSSMDSGLVVADGFASTRWTLVLTAGAADSARQRLALESLCRAYWKPVFLYARRRGFSPHDAEDATQGFFAHIMEGDWLKTVDREKGSFRGFLYNTFRLYLSNEYQKGKAEKRGGGVRFVSFDLGTATVELETELQSQRDPADEYERSFALTLMERASARLAQEHVEAGEKKRFEQLKRFLNAPPGKGEYEAVARELGVERGRVAKWVHHLSLRYRELVRSEAAETLVDRRTLDEELKHLLRALEK